MKCNAYEIFFMNFANKTKLDIIYSLREGPLSVLEIAQKIGEEQSKISHNLRKMSECRLLNVEQRGKQRIYSLNRETVIPMLELVEKHVKTCCCAGGCSKLK
ncbi:winged helix-turn-helix transcriptional regulator [Candidatus Woesearchaeota archaeon]|nr:winged helix-turn-helix transcriptional regulator [Candidatus Woesearchaeota archaeon]